MKKNPIIYALGCALGETAYILLVALLIKDGEKIFGNNTGILGIILSLLLLVVSAAISGALVLGKPILLYLEGKKKEAVNFFRFTLGWLLLFLVLIFVILAIL